MKNSELETERLAALAAAELDELEKFLPGTFGCHEALHVASVLMDSVSRDLLDHPAVLLDPEFYALAYEAHMGLFNLYQAIGAKHLEVDEVQAAPSSAVPSESG